MISSEISKHVFNGDGTTKIWPYTFPILAAGDISVFYTDALGAVTEVTTNFSVDTALAQVTYPVSGSAIAIGTKLTLKRALDLTQLVDWKRNGNFDAELLEDVVDRLTMEVQQVDETLDRCVKFSVDQTVTDEDTSTFLSDVQTAQASALASQAAATASQTAAAASAAAAAASAAAIATPIPIASGGTNSTTALNNNRNIVSSGGKIVEAAAIAAAKILISDANGLPIAANANADMGANKITGLAAATANGDAVRYEQMILRSQNILDNGGFEIWQRGTSFTPAHAAHTADRFQTRTDESANVTLTKETATIDSVGLASIKVVVASAGASKFWNVRNYIENAADYRGKTIALSVRVYSSVASAIKIRITDSVGAVSGSSAYHTGGGGWETLTATLAVSATATSNTYVDIGMLDAGDKKNGTYYFDSAMLVLGSEAVAFVPTLPHVDFARCQRFYQRFGDLLANENIAVGQCWATTNALFVLPFGVRFRAAPTVTIVGATGFDVQNSVAGNIACTALAGSTVTQQEVRLSATVASGLTAGNASILRSTVTTSYIECSADL